MQDPILPITETIYDRETGVWNEEALRPFLNKWGLGGRRADTTKESVWYWLVEIVSDVGFVDYIEELKDQNPSVRVKGGITDYYINFGNKRFKFDINISSTIPVFSDCVEEYKTWLIGDHLV